MQGNEIPRPEGVLKDGSVGKNGQFEQKKKVRWAMLYRDRIDFSIALPLRGKDPQVKATQPLAGCTVEAGKSNREVVIKDTKGKKAQTLGCETAAEAEQWLHYLRQVSNFGCVKQVRLVLMVVFDGFFFLKILGDCSFAKIFRQKTKRQSTKGVWFTV